MILIIPKIGYCKVCEKVFEYVLVNEPEFCSPSCERKSKKQKLVKRDGSSQTSPPFMSK